LTLLHRSFKSLWGHPQMVKISFRGSENYWAQGRILCNWDYCLWVYRSVFCMWLTGKGGESGFWGVPASSLAMAYVKKKVFFVCTPCSSFSQCTHYI